MKTRLDLKWVLVLWIFIFPSLQAVSQSVIKGKVVDAETNQALPFASVYFKDSDRGTISNPEGCFRVVAGQGCSEELIFSCIGYTTLKYKIENGIPSKIPMHRTEDASKLLETQKINDSDGAAEIFYSAVKNARRNKEARSSRCYFSLETMNGAKVPVEIAEAFYQSEYTIRKGLSEMSLKNGRFGMVEQDGPFNSLIQTAEALEKQELFLKARDSYFPYSPCSLSASTGTKEYIFTLERLIQDREEMIVLIKFTPVTNSDGHYAGEAYVGINDRQFRQIKLYIKDTWDIPFILSDPSAKLNDVNLEIVLNFRKDLSGQIIYDHIRFNYGFEYIANNISQLMRTEALLVFYDYAQPFMKPISDALELATDYDQMMITPFQRYFWDQNYLFEPTTAMKDHTDYIVSNGVVINYEDHLGVKNPACNTAFKVWNEDSPITWDDFLVNDIKDPGIDTPRFSWNYKRLVPDDSMNLDFSIFLDCNMDVDSLYFCCKTIFNRRSSYYFGTKDSIALEYINLQFNLVESVRRTMAESLCKNRYHIKDAADLNMIYQDYMNRLDKMMLTMIQDVQQGQNHVKLAEWKMKVSEDLNKATALLSQ